MNSSYTFHFGNKSPVVVVGPPADAIGGMAAVVEQMATGRFGGRYQIIPFAVTGALDTSERLFSKLRRHLSQSPRLAGVIRSSGARLAHIHTCSGFSFLRSAMDMHTARRCGCRVVLHIHGGMFDRFHDEASPLAKGLIRLTLARADRVIALSNQWREKLRRMAPQANICVIENAVVLPPLQLTQANNGPCRFLMLGRMDEIKGVEELVQAAAMLHESGTPFTLTLAGPPGTAGDEHSMADRINRLGLARIVRYIGPVRGLARDERFLNSDVYVQPSRFEGLPLAVLEAMSHGLPVIATDVGAMPEILADSRAGVIVPRSDVAAIAGAMNRLALDQTLRRAMGTAARTIAAERFSIERFERELSALYDDLCAEPKRSVTQTRVQSRDLVSNRSDDATVMSVVS